MITKEQVDQCVFLIDVYIDQLQKEITVLEQKKHVLEQVEILSAPDPEINLTYELGIDAMRIVWRFIISHISSKYEADEIEDRYGVVKISDLSKINMRKLMKIKGIEENTISRLLYIGEKYGISFKYA